MEESFLKLRMAFPLKIRGRSFGPHKYLSDSDSDVVSRILVSDSP